MSRNFLNSLIAGFVALAALAPLASQAAEAWPTRAVRLVSVFPPGGSVDSNARMLGQKLSERWKQPVVIENRGGAGSSIGATTIAQAPPDGYSLLVASPAHAINATHRMRGDAAFGIDGHPLDGAVVRRVSHHHAGAAAQGRV